MSGRQTAVLFFAIPPLLMSAQLTHALSLDELKALSLAELSNVEVSIASKTPQRISDSAAAVYLITQEDIRRSGATSLPEVLRMVPGMNVASITSSTSAVSARGFHDIFSNKFLVMLDGRSLYTPLFSGMFWDAHDIDLKDIERIEVIRGPSAAVWGSNAMNGVINIITRSALDSSGSRLSTTIGSHEKVLSFSQTQEISEQHAIRTWGKLRKNHAFLNRDGEDAHDSWHQGRIGLRSDYQISDRNAFTLDTAWYKGQSDQYLELIPNFLAAEDIQEISGGHLLLRWDHKESNLTEHAQVYLDHHQRDDYRLDQTTTTLDLAYQRSYQYSPQANFSWGLNFRHTDDNVEGLNQPTRGIDFKLQPATDQYNTVGLSLQQEYRFNEEIKLLAGLRLDHHAFTGLEAQPTLRALWKVSPTAELWAAASKATRTPSRYEKALSVTTPVLAVAGNNDLKSETLSALEAGFRLRPDEALSLNGTLFINRYKHLASLTELLRIEPFFVPGYPYATRYLSYQLGNDISARSYGLELDSRWQVRHDWQLKLGYSWMRVNSKDITATTESAIAFNNLPIHQLYLNSAWDIRDNLELDATLYYVDELEESEVGSYTRFDLRLGWLPTPDLELSLLAKNLFDDQHAEYSPTSTNYAGGLKGSLVPRSFAVQASWRF